MGKTLRAFQPTIREVVEASQDIRGTLEQVGVGQRNHVIMGLGSHNEDCSTHAQAMFEFGAPGVLISPIGSQGRGLMPPDPPKGCDMMGACHEATFCTQLNLN